MDFQTIVAVIMVFFVLTLVLSMSSKKKQQSSWHGVLEKKIYKENNDSANVYYTLRFRSYDGKKIDLQVSEAIYNSFELGDRVIKKPGEAYPEKMGSS